MARITPTVGDGISIHDPLVFVQGDTWEVEFDCLDLDNTPLDLYAAQSIVWKLDTADRSRNVLTRTLADGAITITDANGGKLLLQVSPADTIGLPLGYFYDAITVTTWNGWVTTQSQGRIQVVAPMP